MSTSLKAPPPLPPSPAAQPLGHEEKLRRYTVARRSFLARGAVRRTIAVILALALAAIVADIFIGLPAAVRTLLLCGIGATAAALLIRWWWRPARALDEAAAAREVERAFPILGQRLRTLREIENSPADQRAAPQLVSALGEDTQRRMARIEPQTMIAWETLRMPLRAALALATIFAALLLAWPEFRTGAARLLLPVAPISFTKVAIENTPDRFIDRENPLIVARISGRPAAEAMLFLREQGGEWSSVKMSPADSRQRFNVVLTGRAKSFDYYVTAGDGRTAQRHMRCLVTPKIESAAAELQLPEYTGVPLQHSAGGDVRALEDTKTRVIFQLNHALTSASARIAEGRELPVTISGNQLIVETTLARGEIIYQLQGRDAEGLELAPASYKMIGIEDKLPEVELLEPAKDVEATTVWEIVARVRAKDDFGVAQLGIILVAGDEMKIVVQREIDAKDQREATEIGSAMLEEFPLTIHDNLKLYAFALDHKPREGARAVSHLRGIDIRQFKIRWRLGGAGKPPMSGNQLQELLALIREQRKVVSEVFVLKENGAPADGDAGVIADKIAARQDRLADLALALKEEVEMAGTMSNEDLVLLDTAVQQMGEASQHLGARLLRPAYRQADAALSSLLAMKKLIMKLLAQQQQPVPSPSEDSSKQKPLSELAAEAERLAREEREIRGKVSPQPAEGQELEMTQHRQDVAVTDAGELYAALVAHAEATELALQRMDAAEKAMQKAEETMRNAAPQDAAPDLQTAEEKLLALALQLRALDERNLAETMGKLSEMAAKAKERMEEEQKEPAESAGEKPTAGAESKPANSPEAAEAGQEKADGKKGEGDQQGSGASQKENAASGEQKPASAGKGRESLGQVADQAETLDDVLQSLAKKLGKEKGEPLRELRTGAGTDSLAPDVRGLGSEPDPAKAGKSAGALAERFGKVADKLASEQRLLQQSLIEQLAKMLARTRQLKENDSDSERKGSEGAGEAGGEKEDREKKSEGTKGGGKEKAEPKPGQNRAKGGEQKGGENFGGLGVGTYLKELQRLDDDVIARLSRQLEHDLRSGAFSTSTLEAVEHRLNLMLDELLRVNLAKRSADRIPDEYEHLVDEYFRALSDDLGGEEWDKNEAEEEAK